MLCYVSEWNIASLLYINLTMTELETLKMTSCYQLQWKNVASSTNTLHVGLVTFSCSPISQEVTAADGSTFDLARFLTQPSHFICAWDQHKKNTSLWLAPTLVLALHRVSNWGSLKCNANVPPPLTHYIILHKKHWLALLVYQLWVVWLPMCKESLHKYVSTFHTPTTYAVIVLHASVLSWATQVWWFESTVAKTYGRNANKQRVRKRVTPIIEHNN